MLLIFRFGLQDVYLIVVVGQYRVSLPQQFARFAADSVDDDVFSGDHIR